MSHQKRPGILHIEYLGNSEHYSLSTASVASNGAISKSQARKKHMRLTSYFHCKEEASCATTYYNTFLNYTNCTN